MEVYIYYFYIFCFEKSRSKNTICVAAIIIIFILRRLALLKNSFGELCNNLWDICQTCVANFYIAIARALPIIITKLIPETGSLHIGIIVICFPV